MIFAVKNGIKIIGILCHIKFFKYVPLVRTLMISPYPEKKKNNDELTESEIRFVVNGAAKGSIPDYQLSAFLMAVCINSMTERDF